MSKPKFKVGDRVTIKNQKGLFESFNGHAGEVARTYQDVWRRRWYEVILDKAKDSTFVASAREMDFEVNQKSEPAEPVFKKGDYVKVKRGYFKGMVGVVTRVGKDPCPGKDQICCVHIDEYKGHGDLGFYNCELEKVEPANTNTDEVRSVYLSLKMAREWYEQGGELRKLALCVYTEDELKPKPKAPHSWKEYCQSLTRDNQYYINSDSQIVQSDNAYQNMIADQDMILLTSKELAEKFLAMMQLMSLRQAWIGDWEPDWNNHQQGKWCITYYCQAWPWNESGCRVEVRPSLVSSLSFPTEEMAEEFIKYFKDLLEKAKGLY